MPAPFSSTLARHNRVMAEYLRYNTKALPADIVRKKGQSLAFGLFKETKAIAPKQKDIESKADIILKHIEKEAKKAGVKLTFRQLLSLTRKEIARRVGAIRYLATGYLPAVQRTRARVNAGGLPNVKEPRGSYKDGTGNANPSITIINSTPGIVAANEKHGITRKAINAATADMIVYIRRKRDEAARILNRS